MIQPRPANRSSRLTLGSVTDAAIVKMTIATKRSMVLWKKTLRLKIVIPIIENVVNGILILKDEVDHEVINKTVNVIVIDDVFVDDGFQFVFGFFNHDSYTKRG
jgi:hypothetical protein